MAIASKFAEKIFLEVFDIIANCDRRLQLRPLCGTGKIEEISPDFPQEGSHYHVKLIDDGVIEEYDTIVTSFVANQKEICLSPHQ